MDESKDFLNAWKQALGLLKYTGHFKLFGVLNSEQVKEASSLNDIRPVYELFAKELVSVSSSERVYLLSLYSFYNRSDTEYLARAVDSATPSMGTVAAFFAGCPELEALTNLMQTYRGW
ncbi:MAG: hypothetical protein JKY89_06025 [Immundisolibacteraceae bacterium]|nr:hypothetical protein [Immundisolibacteraceae bacterium]